MCLVSFLFLLELTCCCTDRNDFSIVCGTPDVSPNSDDDDDVTDWVDFCRGWDVEALEWEEWEQREFHYYYGAYYASPPPSPRYTPLDTSTDPVYDPAADPSTASMPAPGSPGSRVASTKPSTSGGVVVPAVF